MYPAPCEAHDETDIFQLHNPIQFSLGF